MALLEDLPTLDHSFLGLPFADEAVFSDWVDSFDLDIARFGQPFASNPAAYETTKQGLGVLTANGNITGAGHRIGRPAANLTASATMTGAAVVRKAAKYPNALDFHFLGQPAADQPGDTYIDTLTLNYALLGKPFAPNTSAVYRTTKTGNGNLTSIDTATASANRRRPAAAALTASATLAGAATVRKAVKWPNALDFHFLGFPAADQPGDTYIDTLTLDYALRGLPFGPNTSAIYRTTKTGNVYLTATATTGTANTNRRRRANVSATASATLAGTAIIRANPQELESLDFHHFGLPYFDEPAKPGIPLASLDYALLGKPFASRSIEVVVYSETATGGCVIGGEATVVKAYNNTATSGGMLGGDYFGIMWTEIAEGGCVVGTTGLVSATRSLTGSGGSVIGQTFLVQSQYSITSTGGLVNGESGPAWETDTITGTGGAVLGGPSFANGFAYRRAIIIPAGQVSADLNSFVLAFVVNDISTDVVQFEDDDDNILPHEVAAFEDDTLHVFAKCDLAAASDNTFYLYYN